MANRLQGYSWDMKGYSPRIFQIDSEEITEEENTADVSFVSGTGYSENEIIGVYTSGTAES